MCGRLKWRTNAWRFSAARSSEIPRINLARCTDPRGWIGLPATGEGGESFVGIFPEGRRHHLTYFLNLQYHALQLDFNFPNVSPFWKLSGEVK